MHNWNWYIDFEFFRIKDKVVIFSETEEIYWPELGFCADVSELIKNLPSDQSSYYCCFSFAEDRKILVNIVGLSSQNFVIIDANLDNLKKIYDNLDEFGKEVFLKCLKTYKKQFWGNEISQEESTWLLTLCFGQ